MKSRQSPLLLWVVAYFFVVGIIGLFWPLLDSRPLRLEPASASLVYRVIGFMAYPFVDIGYLVAGLAILKRQTWAFRLTCYVLLVSAIESGRSFAWGYARGFAQEAPSIGMISMSVLTFMAWHLVLGYIVYREAFQKPHAMQ